MKQRQYGFNMMEVLIALVVFIAGYYGIIILQGYLLRQNELNQNYIMALSYANQEIEAYKYSAILGQTPSVTPATSTSTLAYPPLLFACTGASQAISGTNLFRGTCTITTSVAAAPVLNVQAQYINVSITWFDSSNSPHTVTLGDGALVNFEKYPSGSAQELFVSCLLGRNASAITSSKTYDVNNYC